MIGRGAQGRPWLLAQVAAELYGLPAPVVPVGDALTRMVQDHYSAMLEFYGADLGLRVARKHLGWYLQDAGCGAALRKELLTTRAPDAVLKTLPRALDPIANKDAAA